MDEARDFDPKWERMEREEEEVRLDTKIVVPYAPLIFAKYEYGDRLSDDDVELCWLIESAL